MLLKFTSDRGAHRSSVWFNPELVTRVDYLDGALRMFFPDGQYVACEMSQSEADSWVEQVSDAGRPVAVEVQNFPEPVEGQVSR